MGYFRETPAPDRESPPCPTGVQQGQMLFRNFHGFAPGGFARQPCRRVIPEVLVHLGELRGLIYRSDKRDGRARSYIHFMESPPRLASSPDGRHLYILGGRYRVTARGIEG